MAKKPHIPATAPAKFPKGTRLLHLKSGDNYVVHLTPKDGLRMEKTTEPAYAYQRTDGSGPLWVRSAEETEDGRFERVDVRYGPDSPIYRASIFSDRGSVWKENFRMESSKTGFLLENDAAKLLLRKFGGMGVASITPNPKCRAGSETVIRI